MKHYVDADPSQGKIDVAAVALGEVFDVFEYDVVEQNDLLRLGEQRNSPMRIESFIDGEWQHHPEPYEANTEGYRQALAYLAALKVPELERRLVTCNGDVVAHTSSL